MNLDAGQITIISLVLVQLIAFAYGYGKLSQKVNDICKKAGENSGRIDRLEDRLAR